MNSEMLEKGIKKEKYLVEGMTCSGCERTVQKVISNIQGVRSAKADLASASVMVEYEPSLVNIDTIKSAVGNVGYKIMGQQPPHGQREGRDDSVS